MVDDLEESKLLAGLDDEVLGVWKGLSMEFLNVMWRACSF
jgi:hypothetical protein